MTRKLDLSQSVWALTEAHPDLVPILKDLGFAGVANPVVRNTLGRTMTLPEGCRKQGRDLAGVVRVLTEKGFTVEGAA